MLGLDVAPSTLLPSYDPDTGLVLLTGKVGRAVQGRCEEVGRKAALADHLTLTATSSVAQGDTRVFLYELLPEAPFFLECNNFTSSDPHKVSCSLPGWDRGLPRPLVAIWGSAGACGVSGSRGQVCPAAHGAGGQTRPLLKLTLHKAKLYEATDKLY